MLNRQLAMLKGQLVIVKEAKKALAILKGQLAMLKG
jgi:hypothetical protein